jgi:hypothetical protein
MWASNGVGQRSLGAEYGHSALSAGAAGGPGHRGATAPRVVETQPFPQKRILGS